MERQIGDLIRPILAKTQAMYGFQLMLNAVEKAASRKTLIMAARDAGAIDDTDTRLLIEAYQLETA